MIERGRNYEITGERNLCRAVFLSKYLEKCPYLGDNIHEFTKFAQFWSAAFAYSQIKTKANSLDYQLKNYSWPKDIELEISVKFTCSELQVTWRYPVVIIIDV